MNVFAPTWYTLDENGEILSYVNAEWVAWAHEQGYQVWAMFDNEGDNDRAYAAIATESGREEVIAYLLAQCEELGLDGINVDFEILSEDTAACLIEFVRELGAVLRPKGYILSVDVSVPRAWSYYYRRDLLAKASDYIIVMAYDEHYSGGDAGSVSSMQFTSSAIDDMLLQVPPEKLILGIPFYTRIWYVSEEGTSSEAWGMNRTQTYIEENKLEPVLDESTGQDFVTRTVDQVEEKIWIENERSVRTRVEMASDAGLAGVACWKIGLEKEETWDWIRESLGQ